MPQDPLASLHPLRTRRRAAGRKPARPARLDAGARPPPRRCALFAASCELPDPGALLRRFPHQLSGGQRQRVGLALALAGGPRLLIADEPTSALDPRLAREMLAMLDRLRRERGLAVVLISHDLPLVGRHAAAAWRSCSAADWSNGRRPLPCSPHPRHDYTRALLAADRLPAAPRRPTSATRC